jgi:hypothetical protein
MRFGKCHVLEADGSLAHHARCELLDAARTLAPSRRACPTADVTEITENGGRCPRIAFFTDGPKLMETKTKLKLKTYGNW